VIHETVVVSRTAGWITSAALPFASNFDVDREAGIPHQRCPTVLVNVVLLNPSCLTEISFAGSELLQFRPLDLGVKRESANRPST